MAVADFGNAVGVAVLERRSAAYHRAVAARARRLRAEATTAWSKEYLTEAVAQHEQIAAEIERTPEPDAPATSEENETAAPSQAKPPDNKAGGSATSPAGNDRRSGLGAGDYSNQRLTRTTLRVWLTLVGFPKDRSLSQRIGSCRARREQLVDQPAASFELAFFFRSRRGDLGLDLRQYPRQRNSDPPMPQRFEPHGDHAASWRLGEAKAGLTATLSGGEPRLIGYC